MFIKTIKKTGYAFLAAAALSIGGTSLTTSAQAAPLHINPLESIEIVQDGDVVEVRGRHGFRGHRGGFRKFNRGHRGSFRGHHSRGHSKSFRSRKFSRHGSFRSNRFSRHRGGFRGQRFSGRRFR